MMKLTKAQKLLIAFCYSDNNALRYEFVFDKPCDYFAVRFFLNEYSYFLVEFPDENDSDKVMVTEWETVKSSYHPSDRCTHLNKYLKKYRTSGKNSTLTVQQLTTVLNRIPMPQGFMRDRSSYRPWRETRRASGRF